jgi:hypothetical protein
MVCLESIALMVFLLFTGTKCGFAQATKDFQLRQELGIAWKPLKRTEVNVGYRLNLHDNASRFRRSMFSVGGNYELFKWWRIGAEYRYYTSYDQDRNRFQAFTRWNYKMGRLNLSYRLQYQQTQDYFDEEYLQYNPPARVLRNRVQVRYLLTKKIELYSFAESFTQRSEGEYLFYRMRYAAGMEYLYKRRHSFNLELFANDEFNLKRPEDRLTLVLGYTFHIDKKKKRGSADKAEPAPEAVPKGN